MQQNLPMIQSVVPAQNDFVLEALFTDQTRVSVDMTGVVHRLKAFAPLRDLAVFRQVQVINHGGGIGWPCGLDYSAGALRRLAEAQRAMTGVEFRAWTERLHLSNNEAGDVLGLSPRTVKAYKTRTDPLPAAVAISCRVLEHDPQELQARFRPRKAGRPVKFTRRTG